MKPPAPVTSTLKFRPRLRLAPPRMTARMWKGYRSLPVPARMRLAAVEPVERPRRLQQAARRLAKPLAVGELAHPFGRRSPAPRIRRRGDPLALSALEQLGGEVEEGAVFIVHLRATIRAVEARLNERVTTGVQIP